MTRNFTQSLNRRAFVVGIVCLLPTSRAFSLLPHSSKTAYHVVVPLFSTTTPEDLSPVPAPKDFDKELETHKSAVHALKSWIFDTLYPGTTIGRSYARFYALETIARMPYFAYLSVLHLLETLGQWRQVDRLALHFAETQNEMHHLLIMEELLTPEQPTHDASAIDFRDRFIAQHMAFGYYWLVVLLYMVMPATAYSLNQAVEEEAFATYDKFLGDNESYLKAQPAPRAAVDYYLGPERMRIDPLARPGVVCATLFDCFVAIRDDELEHSSAMDKLKREH